MFNYHAYAQRLNLKITHDITDNLDRMWKYCVSDVKGRCSYANTTLALFLILYNIEKPRRV